MKRRWIGILLAVCSILVVFLLIAGGLLLFVDNLTYTPDSEYEIDSDCPPGYVFIGERMPVIYYYLFVGILIMLIIVISGGTVVLYRLSRDESECPVS